MKVRKQCRTVNEGFAAKWDTEAMNAMSHIVKQSGKLQALVDLQRVQPRYSSLDHLYRFLWQWWHEGNMKSQLLTLYFESFMNQSLSLFHPSRCIVSFFIEMYCTATVKVSWVFMKYLLFYEKTNNYQSVCFRRFIILLTNNYV